MNNVPECCEGENRVGPLPKQENQPDFVVIVTSKQHEHQKALDQEKNNGN